MNPLEPDMRELEAVIEAHARDGAPVLGRYAEPRLIYSGGAFFAGSHPASDRRTVHLGIDVFLPAGTAVHTPLDASVHSMENCPQPFDYGGLVTLRHHTDDGVPFFTLYGHLSPDFNLTVGQPLAAGAAFARLGSAAENGGWPPHLHFQLGLLDTPGSDWLGVADPDEFRDWRALFPDPAPLLGLPGGHAAAPVLDGAALLARGRAYLDAFSNVPHVGHAHPRVVEAAHRQMQRLNTNTRYLHPALEDYADALTERMPAGLEVCFFLNSASEANELAVRAARAQTGARGMIVPVAGATATPAPRSTRGATSSAGKAASDARTGCTWYRSQTPTAASTRRATPMPGSSTPRQSARSVKRSPARAGELAGFISEPFPSVGGQIVPPLGYLRSVYAQVRAAGGMCIAGEVQTGLGRLGRFQWGFEQQGAVPDVVVLGKPIGNGHPLAALVTTREIADSFDTSMEFFSTFGGSTLSCVIGLEVLRILDDEALALNAERVGQRMLDGLRSIAGHTPAIGDVRGMGLFLGVEMTEPGGAPSRVKSAYVVNRLRERRILVGSEGPHDNVIKIRGPLCISADDADHFLAVAAEVFAETPLRRAADLA